MKNTNYNNLSITKKKLYKTMSFFKYCVDTKTKTHFFKSYKRITKNKLLNKYKWLIDYEKEKAIKKD